MAVIVGIRLKAQVIYSFSGQYSLEPWMKRRWLSEYAQDETRNRYYNIVDMVKQSKIPIIYCYPAQSGDDKEQAELVKGCDNVISFAFNYNEHGHTVLPYNYKYLLNEKPERLKILSQWLSNRTIKAPCFLILTGGIGGCIDNIRNIKRLLKAQQAERGNGKVL